MVAPVNRSNQALEAPPRRRYLPLLHRVAGLNALALIVVVAATILVLAPDRVASFRVDAEGVRGSGHDAGI